MKKPNRFAGMTRMFQTSTPPSQWKNEKPAEDDVTNVTYFPVKNKSNSTPQATVSPTHTPKTVGADTRARIINDHPYSKQRPEFAQTLISDDKITLNQAIDALNELGGIEDKPSMSRYQKQQARLDEQAEATSSKAQTTATQSSSKGTMTRLEQLHARLATPFEPVGGGDAA